MKRIILSSVLCAVLVLGAGVAHAETASTTTTTSTSSMIAKIQELMKLIAELKAKIEAARGEIKELAMDLGKGA